jgi:hypothetical protein
LTENALLNIHGCSDTKFENFKIFLTLFLKSSFMKNLPLTLPLTFFLLLTNANFQNFKFWEWCFKNSNLSSNARSCQISARPDQSRRTCFLTLSSNKLKKKIKKLFLNFKIYKNWNQNFSYLFSTQRDFHTFLKYFRKKNQENS